MMHHVHSVEDDAKVVYMGNSDGLEMEELEDNAKMGPTEDHHVALSVHLGADNKFHRMDCFYSMVVDPYDRNNLRT